MGGHSRLQHRPRAHMTMRSRWFPSRPQSATPRPSTASDETKLLNAELHRVARETNDVARARELVASGASISCIETGWSTNMRTPLHQAAFHGKYEMAQALIQMGAALDLPSNPCGRGARGTPIELAQGGGHFRYTFCQRKLLSRRELVTE